MVIVVTGRPLTFGPYNASGLSLLDDVSWPPCQSLVASCCALLQLDVVLVVGRPGAEGGVATANMVFGLSEPSGRFAASWPRTVVSPH